MLFACLGSDVVIVSCVCVSRERLEEAQRKCVTKRVALVRVCPNGDRATQKGDVDTALGVRVMEEARGRTSGLRIFVSTLYLLSYILMRTRGPWSQSTRTRTCATTAALFGCSDPILCNTDSWTTAVRHPSHVSPLVPLGTQLAEPHTAARSCAHAVSPPCLVCGRADFG